MKENCKILIVDDEPTNLWHLVDMLEMSNQNYLILQANTADRALYIAKKVLPSIIITDWNMPEKNGLELIKELKEYDSTKHIPVIMATGFMLTPEDIKTALEAGAVDYVRKPIDATELIARVHSALTLAAQHKEIIKLKNKELSESALYLIKCNEFNKKMISKLEKLNLEDEQNIKILEEALAALDSILKSETWEKFDVSFQAVYGNFYKNLLSEFPKLSKSELKLSALVALGMDSKDIASILNLSVDSVKVARYRLRKKLNLNAKENLHTFLSTF